MDIRLVIEKIMPDADYNPACFNFTESEAREKSLWRDDRDMPTSEEMDSEWALIQADLVANEHKELRKKEYEKDDLSFNKFVELMIEEDDAGMADFRSRRNAIKTAIPKK